MGENEKGPDFGIFNFTELFSQILYNKSYKTLSTVEKNELIKKYEHKVSDHMPIWIRLPLPE
jgi:predicted Zn-dependent protease